MQLDTITKFIVGNHAFAILCGKECYESMAESFKEVFGEINKIISEGGIDVDGEKIQLEFFLGGDYKVVLCCKFINNQIMCSAAYDLTS